MYTFVLTLFATIIQHIRGYMPVDDTSIRYLVNIYNSNVTFFYDTFASAYGNISDWDTSHVTNMENVFSSTFFNDPIGNWDVSNVKSMANMFYGNPSFNQPIGNWNTSSVIDMKHMFDNAASFNQPIGNWDVAAVQDMQYMFANNKIFNQDIKNWNTAAVKNMRGMFAECTDFNQPVNLWNTQSVTDMAYMFYKATSFNQPIETWNTSSVVDMNHMFQYASLFNQPISIWDTSHVTDMDFMFTNAVAYNQSICWNTINVITKTNMFDETMCAAYNTCEVCITTPPTKQPTIQQKLQTIADKICNCDNCCEVDQFDVYQDIFFTFSKSVNNDIYVVNERQFEDIKYFNLYVNDDVLRNYYLVSTTPINCSTIGAAVTTINFTFHHFGNITQIQENICHLSWDNLFTFSQEYSNMNGDIMIGIFLYDLENNTRIFLTEDKKSIVKTLYNDIPSLFSVSDIDAFTLDNSQDRHIVSLIVMLKKNYPSKCNSWPTSISVSFQHVQNQPFPIPFLYSIDENVAVYNYNLTMDDIEFAASEITIINSTTARYSIITHINNLTSTCEIPNEIPLLSNNIRYTLNTFLSLPSNGTGGSTNFANIRVVMDNYNPIPCNNDIIPSAHLFMTLNFIAPATASFDINYMGNTDTIHVGNYTLFNTRQNTTCKYSSNESTIICSISYISDFCIPMNITRELTGMITCIFPSLGILYNNFVYIHPNHENVENIDLFYSPALRTFNESECPAIVSFKNVSNQVGVHLDYSITDLSSPITVGISFDSLGDNSTLTLRITDVLFSVSNTKFARKFNVYDKAALMKYPVFPYYNDAHFCRTRDELTQGIRSETCLPFYSKLSDRWNDYCEIHSDQFDVPYQGYYKCQGYNQRSTDRFSFTPSLWDMGVLNVTKGTMVFTVIAALDDCATPTSTTLTPINSPSTSLTAQSTYVKGRVLQTNKRQTVMKTISVAFNLEQEVTSSPTKKQTQLITPVLSTPHPTIASTDPLDECFDNIHNNKETDIDCGGDNCIQRCSLYQECQFSLDCKRDLFCNSTDNVCVGLPADVPIQTASVSISVISTALVAIQSIQSSSVGSSFDAAFMGATGLAMNLKYTPMTYRSYEANFFWSYMALIPIPNIGKNVNQNRRLLTPDGWLQNMIPHPYLASEVLVLSFLLTSTCLMFIITLYAKFWVQLESVSVSSRYAMSLYSYTIIIPTIYFMSIAAQIAFTNKMGIALGVRIFCGFAFVVILGLLCFFWYTEWKRYKQHFSNPVDKNHTYDHKTVKLYHLSTPFNQTFYWFWVIRLITSILRGLFLAFLAIYPLTQTILVISTFVTCLALQLAYKPYRDKILHILHAFNLCCTIAFHICFILFSTYEWIEPYNEITWIMFGLQMAITLSFVIIAIRGFIISRQQRSQTK